MHFSDFYLVKKMKTKLASSLHNFQGLAFYGEEKGKKSDDSFLLCECLFFI